MTENYDIQIALEEMKAKLERQYAGMDAIKATARSLLSSSSLVLAVLSTLQIFLNTDTINSAWAFWYRAGVVIALVS
jgi:hypothetical protein